MGNLKPYRLQSITELHRIAGFAKPQHPLISIINLEGLANNTDITSVIFDLQVRQAQLSI
jgi:AraC family transcriptional activator of pobA